MVMRRRFFNNNIEYFDINDYLTIEALEDNLQIYFPHEDLMYGIDGIGWQKLVAGAYSPAISKGQTISFKGNVSSSPENINSFTITKRCNLLGNCMSLTSNDDPHFYKLFSDCSTIVYVSKKFLPATTLSAGCYESMFRGCTSLTSAPELPATKLDSDCYQSMFSGCTSLTTAPELPAAKLANYCYQSMFYDCKGLTTAPELPATTLAISCYNGMFSGCSSLTKAPELPVTTLAIDCYSDMFSGCSSLTVAPELPATTLTSYCYNGMFYNCSSLTKAPELPATKLATYCYDHMFSYCTNLTTAPELPATTLANYCYIGMFNGCSKLNYIKMLATNISATNCLYNWVYNVSSTGTFVKNPAMTSLPTGANGIPSGWTVYNDGEEPGGNLITFTIAGTEYQAEEGMTWGEWVDSEYNTNGFYISGVGIFRGTQMGGQMIGQIYNDNSLSTYTEPSDTIINGHSYGIASGGAGD